MSGTVDLDINRLSQKIKTKSQRVQVALDIQVVKDSNFYAPEMDGTLKASALRSDYGSGKISWDVEYAKEQYYGKPNKSRDVNPNARMKWFEEAKATNKERWEKLANDKFNQ